MSRTRPTRNRDTARHFVRHYLEMVAAMIVGMVALGPLWTLVLDAAGAPALLDRPELNVLLMATNMTIAMSAWMRYRGHRWPATAQMATAMYLPFIMLFLPLWLGMLTPTGLVVIGHVLMLTGMAAVMLLRPAEYAAPASHQG
jgi:hypothetical protein